jgi:hypothetical protein
VQRRARTVANTVAIDERRAALFAVKRGGYLMRRTVPVRGAEGRAPTSEGAIEPCCPRGETLGGRAGFY